MSHITRIKTSLVEKEFILQALADLGYKKVELSSENKPLSVFGMGDVKVSVDIKVKVSLLGEIGLRKSGNVYEIVADWWRVSKIKPAEFTQQLTQRYAYHAAIAKLSQQGFTLVEEKVETKGKEKGQIHLLLRRSG